MKKTGIILFLIIGLSSWLSAQEFRTGIKLLVKDRWTGIPFTDTLIITVDDTLQRKMQSDWEGYLYVELPPGKHSISASHIGYQTSKMWGIIVAEQKTSYISLNLDNRGEEKPKKRKGGVKLKMKK
jgi:hypothetical protein